MEFRAGERFGGGKDFPAIATAKHFEQQDAMTQHFLETCREDLQAVAEGGEPSASLINEVTRVNDAPVDESPGEGYHRSSNLVRVRASAAKSLYIKQSTRAKQKSNSRSGCDAVTSA